MIEVTQEWFEGVLPDGATHAPAGSETYWWSLAGNVVGKTRNDGVEKEFFVVPDYAPLVYMEIATLDLIRKGFEAGNIGGDWTVWLNNRYHGYTVTNDIVDDDDGEWFCIGKVKNNLG